MEVVREEPCFEEVPAAAVHWILFRAKAGHCSLVSYLFHLRQSFCITFCLVQEWPKSGGDAIEAI